MILIRMPIKYNNIEDLSKDDAYLRNMAFKICKNNPIADDLLNDFYIKAIPLFNQSRVLSDGFVFICISNAYVNYIKRQKKLDFGLNNLPAVIPEIPDDTEQTILDKLEDEKLYNIIQNRYEQLSWYEGKLLNFSLVMPLTVLAQNTGISYKSLCYTLNKIKIKMGYK